MVERLLMWLNSKSLLAVILLIISALAFGLRFINIDKSPPGFLWDEASFGYEAFSVLKTGKDEYGESFPLLFKAFGEYKGGFYVYLSVPFIAILGLTETATRLPSIIFGSLIPLLGYFLAKELIPKDQKIPLISALLLAISPWAIHFSRGAWEANIALFETMLAVLLLLKARSGKLFLLILSVLVFSLTIYTYSSSKMISSMLLLGLILIYRVDFLNYKMRLRTSILLIFFGLVFVSSLASSEVRSRLVYLNQLNYPRKLEEIEDIKREENLNNTFIFEVYHSEFLEYTRTVVGRYLNYFSPKFLFSYGPGDSRLGLMEYGMMHPFELPFFILGVYLLTKNKYPNKKIFLLWLLVTPLPAALSRDTVSTVRSLPLIFALEFIAALGISSILGNFKKYQAITLSILIFIMGANLTYFWDKLIFHSKIYAKDFLPTYKSAIIFLTENKDKYSQVVFTIAYKEPYIFYLFYNKYPPEKFQSQAKLTIANPPEVGEVEKIDNIEFVPADWHKYRFIKNTLIIGTDLELPSSDIDGKQADLLKVFYNPDSSIAFKAVVTK